MTPVDFRGEPAGIVTRSVAAAVDMLVVIFVLAGVWGVTAALRFLSRPARFTFPSPTWTEVVMIAGLVSVCYLATCWATSGRTYGSQLLGLRVVDRQARRLTWPRSLVRALAYVVLPIGLVWALLDRRNRSLQDLVVGSTVVYDWVPRLPVTRAAERGSTR